MQYLKTNTTTAGRHLRSAREAPASTGGPPGHRLKVPLVHASPPNASSCAGAPRGARDPPQRFAKGDRSLTWGTRSNHIPECLGRGHEFLTFPNAAKTLTGLAHGAGHVRGVRQDRELTPQSAHHKTPFTTGTTADWPARWRPHDRDQDTNPTPQRNTDVGESLLFPRSVSLEKRKQSSSEPRNALLPSCRRRLQLSCRSARACVRATS